MYRQCTQMMSQLSLMHQFIKIDPEAPYSSKIPLSVILSSSDGWVCKLTPPPTSPAPTCIYTLTPHANTHFYSHQPGVSAKQPYCTIITESVLSLWYCNTNCLVPLANSIEWITYDFIWIQFTVKAGQLIISAFSGKFLGHACTSIDSSEMRSFF